MTTVVIGIVAVVVAILGLLVAAANLGYLAMLRNAASKRGIAGEPVAGYVKGQLPRAGGATAVGLLALLLTLGGPVPDVLAMILGAGAGLVAKKSLDGTRARYRSNP